MSKEFHSYETFVAVSQLGVSERPDYCALALTGESCEFLTEAMLLATHAGKFSEVIKKRLRDHAGEVGEARTKALLELGDVLWYLTAAARSLGSSLEEVADLNVQKLTKRRAEKAALV